MVAELECEGLLARARRLNRMVGPVERDTNLPASVPGRSGRFRRFRRALESPGRPYRLHRASHLPAGPRSGAGGGAGGQQGDLDSETTCAAPAARDTITLDSEHDDAMAAIARAQKARDAINAALLSTARTRWPEQWRSLTPRRCALPAGSAMTWMGAPTSAGRPASATAWRKRPSAWPPTPPCWNRSRPISPRAGRRRGPQPGHGRAVCRRHDQPRRGERCRQPADRRHPDKLTSAGPDHRRAGKAGRRQR
jgi:hypothetical protein